MKKLFAIAVLVLFGLMLSPKIGPSEGVPPPKCPWPTACFTK